MIISSSTRHAATERDARGAAPHTSGSPCASFSELLTRIDGQAVAFDAASIFGVTRPESNADAGRASISSARTVAPTIDPTYERKVECDAPNHATPGRAGAAADTIPPKIFDAAGHSLQSPRANLDRDVHAGSPTTQFIHSTPHEGPDATAERQPVTFTRPTARVLERAHAAPVAVFETETGLRVVARNRGQDGAALKQEIKALLARHGHHDAQIIISANQREAEHG